MRKSGLAYSRAAQTVGVFLRHDELEKKSPPKEKGQRPSKFHQWLTQDAGNPLLAQHLHSLIMFQRLALQSGSGWHRFVSMVDKVLPKRGNNLELPFPEEVQASLS